MLVDNAGRGERLQRGREKLKKGWKRGQLYKKILLGKASLKSKSVRKKSFHSFTGFSSHYNERNIWKAPSSHHRLSPLLTTFRLNPGKPVGEGIPFWNEEWSNFISFYLWNDGRPFLMASLSLCLPQRLVWSPRDRCFSGHHHHNYIVPN